MNQSSPIFSKAYDFLSWIIPVTIKFPRQQRFVLAQHIQTSTFALHEALIQAAKAQDPIPFLQQADVELAKVRTYLRLCQDLQYLTQGQYEHGAKMLVEIGKLLGGWLRSSR